MPSSTSVEKVRDSVELAHVVLRAVVRVLARQRLVHSRHVLGHRIVFGLGVDGAALGIPLRQVGVRALAQLVGNVAHHALLAPVGRRPLGAGKLPVQIFLLGVGQRLRFHLFAQHAGRLRGALLVVRAHDLLRHGLGPRIYAGNAGH
jgi:hypothetical protein